MRTVRQIILWVVLGFIGILAALSMVGAFIGADRAKGLFNSPGVVVYWFLLAAVLAAGFVFYRRLLRSPAALAMHLGSLLILLGAMWGSDLAHNLRRAWLDTEKLSRGIMVIDKGRRETRVMDEDLFAAEGRLVPIGEIPFALHLKDFWIEYYGRWELLVAAPVFDKDGHVTDERQTAVPWQMGEPVDVPGTPARLTVIQYIDRAVPTYAPGAVPTIEITLADGTTTTLPAKAGAEVDLADPPMKVRVAQVFLNLRVHGTDEDRQVVDLPGEGVNPAVLVEQTPTGGTPQRRLLMALFPEHGRGDDSPPMRHVFPEPTGAKADPSSHVPAVEVHLECDGRHVHHWFLPGDGQMHAGLDLGALLSQTSDGEPPTEATTGLYLVKPVGTPVRDYYSDLAVLEGDEEVGRKTIEVNHPLHWPQLWPSVARMHLGRWLWPGGYHFYQSGCDDRNEQYTILRVVSDSGLLAVWVGMTLLVAGTFWRFWVAPAARYVGRRQARAVAPTQPLPCGRG